MGVRKRGSRNFNLQTVLFHVRLWSVGSYCALLQEAGRGFLAEGLLQDINRHGEVVLQGVAALNRTQQQLQQHHQQQPQQQQQQQGGVGGSGGDSGWSHHATAALDDLRGVTAAPVEVLHIQDPSRRVLLLPAPSISLILSRSVSFFSFSFSTFFSLSCSSSSVYLFPAYSAAGAVLLRHCPSFWFHLGVGSGSAD